MSTARPAEAQPTFTGQTIRNVLDQIEAGGAGEHDYDQVADRLNLTVQLRALAEQLQHEVVAEVRSITDHAHRVKPPESGSALGQPQVVPRRAADRSPHRFGWDFIGWCLGASKSAMVQRFGA